MTAERLWRRSDVDRFLQHSCTYCSRLEVSAERLAETKTWTTSNGSVLTGQPGDWLVSDGETSWTVAYNVFTATYVRVADGRFRKIALVTARQLDQATTIATIEGAARAEAGDWVVRNPGGDFWPVPAGEFQWRYEPVAA